LRQDDERFRAIGASVVAIAPDSGSGVAKFVRDNAVPFFILADPDTAVFGAYDVVAKLTNGRRCS